jgi:shikimate kinase
MFFNSVSTEKKLHKEISVIRSKSSLIFLVGMMGSGKSTIGNIIARILQYRFVEMDALLEEKLKMSINDIFTKYGEEFFRTEEGKLLDEICLMEKCVVSCGGGTFANSQNIKKINASGISVFLNVSSGVIEARLAGDEKRPLLKNGISISNILLKRIPFYTQAHVMVDILYSNIEKNISQVIEELYKHLL